MPDGEVMWDEWRESGCGLIILIPGHELQNGKKSVLLCWDLKTVFKIVQLHVQDERDTMGRTHLRRMQEVNAQSCKVG